MAPCACHAAAHGTACGALLQVDYSVANLRHIYAGRLICHLHKWTPVSTQ